MARRLPYIYFIVIMTVYFLTRWYRVSVDDPSPFFAHHFTDLLFVPAMGMFSLVFVRMIKRDPRITISPFLVFMQVALVSFYFEYYLPFMSEATGHTSDWIDVSMYVLGGFLFLLLQRKC